MADTEFFIDPDPPAVEVEEGDCDCDNLMRRIKELERRHDAVARYAVALSNFVNEQLYILTNRIETLETNCGARPAE